MACYRCFNGASDKEYAMAAVTFVLQSCIIFLSWDFILIPVNLQLGIQLTKADQKFNVR